MDIVDLLVLMTIIVVLAVMITLSVKRVHSRQQDAFSFKPADLSLYEFGKQTTTINSPTMFP
jgi:hypothetical protein